MVSTNILEAVSKNSNNKVKVAVCDIDGVLRGKVIHKDKFNDVAESSFGFCDVIFGWDVGDICYENSTTTGWHTAYPDAKATIDLSTFREIPWNDNLPFFLADFENDQQMSMATCPRSLLKSVSQKAATSGFTPVFSQEFEWFNFLGHPNELAQRQFNELEPITSGMYGYSLLRPSLYQPYFNDIFDMLAAFNVQLEGLHTETGPGVYEAAIKYDTVLSAADKAVLFKSGVKEIAHKHGIVATFMAKWNQELPGCSGHIHQSLWDDRQENNLFYDASAPHQMSATMQHYLAGVLHCLPDLLPFYAPTINSYKRLVEGTWAPTSASWGIENRTTGVRVIPGSITSQRLELRIPGADANPYLAMAASLASGLWGIQNKMELTLEPTLGNAYADANLTRIPQTLAAATEKMKTSAIANELFGNTFVQHFAATREWEVQQYNEAVTSWELGRYFEII